MGTGQKTPSFKYDPLPSGESYLRLLELLAEPSSDGRLRCRLFATRLDDSCPEYETLSYVWGAKTALSQILCNDLLFEVTESLLHALEQLQPAEGSRLLWIDQLAINQRDSDEKTAQVSMMREIYQRSTRTIAWLDHSTAQSVRAFRVLHVYSQQIFTAADGSQSWVNWPVLRSIPALIFSGKQYLTAPRSLDLSAVDELLQHPWFSRIWIIQEAVVSEKVLVTCGADEIDIDVLLLAVLRSMVLTAGNMKYKFHGLETLVFLTHLRERYLSGHLSPLTFLLENTKGFGATDLRDKFYALYGLTSTNLQAAHISPNYAASMTDVFMQTTVAIMKLVGNLNLLEVASGCSEGDASNMPSWTPAVTRSAEDPVSFTSWAPISDQAYGRNIYRAAFTHFLQGQGVEADSRVQRSIDKMVNEAIGEQSSTDPGNLRIPEYAASKDSQPSVDLEPGGILRISGLLVDKVQEVSEVLPSPFPDLDDMDARTSESGLYTVSWGGAGRFVGITALKVLLSSMIDRDWRGMVLGRRPPRSYPTGESLASAYWKTRCASQMSGYDPGKGFAGFWNTRAATPKVKDANRVGMLMAMSSGQSSSTQLTKVYETLSIVSHWRRLAWTANGYLALLPGAAQEGDLIVVFKGGRLPFVLRADGSAWKLVGPCYVHGIMGGEAFDEESCGDVRIS